MGRLTCYVYCDNKHEDIIGSSDDWNPKGVYISHSGSNENDVEDVFRIRINRSIAVVSAIRISYY